MCLGLKATYGFLFFSISTCLRNTGRLTHLGYDSLLLIFLFIITQFYIINFNETLLVIVTETFNAYWRSTVLNTPANFPADESCHVADSGKVPLGGSHGYHCWLEVQKKACRALGSYLPLPWQPRRWCFCDWCTDSKQPEWRTSGLQNFEICFRFCMWVTNKSVFGVYF